MRVLVKCNNAFSYTFITMALISHILNFFAPDFIFRHFVVCIL